MSKERGKKIGEIMSKCWTDASFKQRLLSDANATLKAEGVEIPAGITVNVLENTSNVINYILPKNPKEELSDADLEAVSGGLKPFSSGLKPLSCRTPGLFYGIG